MKTQFRSEGDKVAFIICDLDTVYHETARHLFYTKTEHGFAKFYPANTPHIEKIYQNFERYAEEMILQIARVHPVPWEKSLSAFIDVIKGEKLSWWLAGSAALAVRGVPISPGDIDIITDANGAKRLSTLLLDFVVEPIIPVKGWICRWFGSAFWHARIDIVGGVLRSVDRPHITDYGPTAAQRLEVVKWQGETLSIPPLDLQLQVSKRRGLTERVKKIEQFMDQSR